MTKMKIVFPARMNEDVYILICGICGDGFLTSSE